MALSAGCRVVCRPKRKYPRKFTAKAAGRVARYAHEAGETCQAILAAIREELPDCQEQECDCVRVGVVVAATVSALAIAATILIARGKANKLAAEETRLLMERLRAAGGKVPAGTIEVLERVEGVLLLSAEQDPLLGDDFQRLVDNLNTLRESKDLNPVVIKP